MIFFDQDRKVSLVTVFEKCNNGQIMLDKQTSWHQVGIRCSSFSSITAVAHYLLIWSV